MNNPLDPVLSWYRTALDSMRVTGRVVRQGIVTALTARHVFYSQPVADSERQLEEAREELERLVVLALTAVFERTLRDFVTALPQVAVPAGDPFGEAVRQELVADMEFWHFSQRLIEVFRDRVAADLRGQVKQIIDYRNWVAHGHTLALPPPTNVLPVVAHQRLTDYLVAAGVIATPTP
jgi:hypothetical protein